MHVSRSVIGGWYLFLFRLLASLLRRSRQHRFHHRHRHRHRQQQEHRPHKQRELPLRERQRHTTVAPLHEVEGFTARVPDASVTLLIHGAVAS